MSKQYKLSTKVEIVIELVQRTLQDCDVLTQPTNTRTLQETALLSRLQKALDLLGVVLDQATLNDAFIDSVAVIFGLDKNGDSNDNNN